MEISWSDHIPGSGIDHDLLRGDWWMDLKIYRDLSYKFRKQAVADNCFTSFISSPSSVWYGLIFMFLTALIVYNGVEKGN